MIQKTHLITSILFLTFIFGCGVDSDLLRDQNEDTATPSGLAYDILSKGLYQYKNIYENTLGFDYYILDENCKRNDCNLLHKEYIIFDGNITEQSTLKHVQLGSTGWYEKSEVNECDISFKNNTFTQNCPDGTLTSTDIKVINLENTNLTDYNPKIITKNDLKDNMAKFNKTANRLDLLESNHNKLYDLLISNNSKCYLDNNRTIPLIENNLSSYSKIVCHNESNFDLILKNLVAPKGSVKIVNNNKIFTGSWQHKTVYKNYKIIEINSSVLPPMFISYYNGYIQLGKIKETEIDKSFLNKDAFNAIYTNLADKYTEISIVKKDLINGLYQLSNFYTNDGYKKIFLNNLQLATTYGSFFDNLSIVNWILTDKGLHRESLECNGNIFFNNYKYTCEDGRKGMLTKVSEKLLKEKLIFKYIKEQNLDFKLDNNDTFFDIGSKELVYRYKSDIDSYKFNPTFSLLIGNLPGKNNATKLFNSNLYITSIDKKNYLKIINPRFDSNGTVEIYTLNNGIELNSTTDTNSTYILNNINKVSTNTWTQHNIAGYSLIKIKLNSQQKKSFSLKNDMVIMPFELSTTKLISGEILEDKNNVNDISYLNQEAYNSIENCILE